MGAPSSPTKRIGLVLCTDGIPAFGKHKESISLKPIQLMNVSLPPAIRCLVNYILLIGLLPDKLKATQQRKYYDFFARHELDDIFNNGINGIKIQLFSLSMDTKGREEILGMQTSQAYQSCSVCLHTWSEGIGGVGKITCDGYRRFLRPNSAARQRQFRCGGITFEYNKVEVLPPPRKRNNEFVCEAVTTAMGNNRPFLAHKWMPLVSAWPGFCWYRLNVPDLMHDIKNLCESLLQVVVGYVKDGFYQSWNKDAKHRAQCHVQGMIVNNECR